MPQLNYVVSDLSYCPRGYKVRWVRSIGGRCFLDEEKPLHCCQVRGKHCLLTRRNVLLCRNRMPGFKISKWIDPDVPMLKMWYDLGWGLQLREIPRVLAAISWHWRARLPSGEISSSVLKWGHGVGGGWWQQQSIHYFCIFIKLSRCFWCTLKFENNCPRRSNIHLPSLSLKYFCKSWNFR